MLTHSSPRSKGIYLLPNLFTVAAMFSGFYAIVAGMKGHYTNAAIAIFIAVLLDGLDGRIARLFDAQSEFGAQFDSLSDMLSFGIAPALVTYSWSLHAFGKIGWLACFIYVVCTALRLARFNIQVKQIDKRYFRGLATPAAAAFLASIVWACNTLNIHGEAIAPFIIVITILLALLKVSMIRYRSFKNVDIQKKVPFIIITLIILLLIFISFDPADILFILLLLYIISGPIETIYTFYKCRKHKKRNTHKLENITKP